MPYLLLSIVIFFAGMMITGSQTGANATAGKLYPARMRTSGIGWALGIGRLGGIAAPVLGGYLLSLGMHPPQIFFSACGFALIAAIATALLAFRADDQPPSDGRLGGAAHQEAETADLRQSAAGASAVTPRRGIGQARLPVERPAVLRFRPRHPARIPGAQRAFGVVARPLR